MNGKPSNGEYLKDKRWLEETIRDFKDRLDAITKDLENLDSIARSSLKRLDDHHTIMLREREEREKINKQIRWKAMLFGGFGAVVIAGVIPEGLKSTGLIEVIVKLFTGR